MQPEIVAPIVLVCLAVVVIVYTQVIGPRRNRRAVAAVLGREGWLRVGPGEAPGWPAIMELAVERAEGRERDVEYDEKTGPFTSHVRRREQRAGKPLEIYRDGGAAAARYAAVAVLEERTSTRTAMRHDRHTYAGREIWIGEARELPVHAPMAAFKATAELFRQAAVPMARARERDPEEIPIIASPPDDRLVERVRAAVMETPTAMSIMAGVYLGPDAWVLAAPLVKAGPRIEEILALARQISAVLDRRPPGR